LVPICGHQSCGDYGLGLGGLGNCRRRRR
jgi:hypothetical protein